jgi:uracil-DNA glycosylase
LTEIELLENVTIVLTLGKIGFHAYCRAASLKGLAFGHGVRYSTGDKILLASYHPSRQNTNTGKLTWQMWLGVFRTARAILDQ